MPRSNGYLRLAAQNVGMEAGANIANSGSQPSDFGLATHIAAWMSHACSTPQSRLRRKTTSDGQVLLDTGKFSG
jgi:hypothetical protein